MTILSYHLKVVYLKWIILEGWKHLSEMVGAFIMEIFMGKMIACVLILIVLLIGVAVLGFVQVVRAWSEIFR